MFNRKLKEQLETLRGENRKLKQQLHLFRRQQAEDAETFKQLRDAQQQLLTSRQRLQAEQARFMSEKQAWLDKFQAAKAQLSVKYQAFQERERAQLAARQQHQAVLQAVRQGREILAGLKQQYQAESKQRQQQKALWADEQTAWQAQLVRWQGEETAYAARLHELEQQEILFNRQLIKLKQQLSEQQAVSVRLHEQEEQREKERQVLRLAETECAARLHELKQQEDVLKHQLAEMEQKLAGQQAAWDAHCNQMRQAAAEQAVQRQQEAVLPDAVSALERGRQIPAEQAAEAENPVLSADGTAQQLDWIVGADSSPSAAETLSAGSVQAAAETVGEQPDHHGQTEQNRPSERLYGQQAEQTAVETESRPSEYAEKPEHSSLSARPSEHENRRGPETAAITDAPSDAGSRLSLIRRAARKHAVPDTSFGRWLAECLLNRHIDGRPDGRPLYAYALNDDEYRRLLDSMGARIIEPDNGAYRDWAACYCLAVSETYRREYDGSEWSWAFFNQHLNIRFKTEPQRYEALEEGLAYWRRPLRKRGDRNRDFLGTLFAEGGLPVKLLLEGDNKFSNLIEHGLQNYRRSLQNGSGLLHCLREKCGGLAKVFQSDEALQLFADTVQILAEWAQCFDLAAQSNAAAYLDTVADGWRSRFPFALPQDQADGLVNRWLGNAAQAQQEARKQSFSCRHYVADGSNVLAAELTFPERLVLPLKNYQGSTRLQWLLFEGEKPLQEQGGTLYARADENGLTVKLPQQKFNCVRQQRGMPLSVRLFADGIVLHTEMLPESALETDAPLWFASGRDNQWWLFSDNDHTALNGVFRVCLPAGFRLPETAAGTSYQAADGRLWYQGSDGLSAEHDDGRLIIGEQRSGAGGQVRLYGRWFDRVADEGGRPVYSGWPAAETPSEWPFTHWLINGKRDERRRPAVYGTVQAACYSDKKCLLRRRITVLPEQLKWSWQSANQNRAAVLTVEGAEGLLLKVYAEGCTVTPEGNRFTVEAKDYPENIFLHIGSSKDCLAVLAVPLPYDGAHLYDEHGRSEARHLTVNELMGKRVRISGGRRIRLHLRVPDAGIAVESTLPLVNGRGEINLYALKPQLVQLLACSNSQDAQIECSVYGDAGQSTPWLKLTLARYRGVVVWNHQTFRNGVLCENDSETKQRFVVKDCFSDGLARRDALVNIMRLDAPEQAPVRLPESAYLGNGQYEITPEYGGGLWLVYPDAASPVPFRPALFDNTGQAAAAETVSPLHQAARTYHPQYYPDAIREVVAQMAEQPEHTGWQYFEALQKSFSHLPLSVFEAWKELARQPQALALAVLRLNGDDVFCDRVRNELAVVWEWLPLSAWQQAVRCYRKYWDQIQQQLVGQGLLSAAAPLPGQLIPEPVLCHSTLLRNHVVRGWLDTEEEAQLQKQLTDMFGKVHDSAYNRRYNELRGRRLPENLNEALQQWLDRQKPTRFFQSVRQMSKVLYDRSLVWLPVFTAAVKAGMAAPEDIRQPLQNTAQLAAEFYRVYAVDPDWFDGLCAASSCYLLAAEDDKESS